MTARSGLVGPLELEESTQSHFLVGAPAVGRLCLPSACRSFPTQRVGAVPRGLVQEVAPGLQFTLIRIRELCYATSPIGAGMVPFCFLLFFFSGFCLLGACPRYDMFLQASRAHTYMPSVYWLSSGLVGACSSILLPGARTLVL